MSTTVRWTSKDLEALPDDGTRYEIINGELFMSKQPHLEHQEICTILATELSLWNRTIRTGRVVYAPGLVFAEDDDVAPDLVWASNETCAAGIDKSGHFNIAPELVIEVLSYGADQERRDREVKLGLYSRRNLKEYWIVDRRARQIEVYRRKDEQLKLVETLNDTDTLTSPLLIGFSCAVAALFK